jgi:predicted dinucleotide-utilizing enzyme
VSVVATLSLAGPGLDARVKIIAVPESRWNVHRQEVEGGFGKVRLEIENVSSDATPRTNNLTDPSPLTTLDGVATMNGGTILG